LDRSILEIVNCDVKVWPTGIQLRNDSTSIFGYQSRRDSV